MHGSMASGTTAALGCFCSTITALPRSGKCVHPTSRHISTAGRTCMGCAEGRTPGVHLAVHCGRASCAELLRSKHMVLQELLERKKSQLPSSTSRLLTVLTYRACLLRRESPAVA